MDNRHATLPNRRTGRFGGWNVIASSSFWTATARCSTRAAKRCFTAPGSGSATLASRSANWCARTRGETGTPSRPVSPRSDSPQQSTPYASTENNPSASARLTSRIRLTTSLNIDKDRVDLIQTMPEFSSGPIFRLAHERQSLDRRVKRGVELNPNSDSDSRK